MVKFFVARHGQNVDNENGILNGHRDLPLTALGEEQARILGNFLKDADIAFDRIYSSPLERAKRTADIAASCLPAAPPGARLVR